MSATMIFGSGQIAVGPSAAPSDQFECQVSDFRLVANTNTVAVPGTFCEGPSAAGQKSSWNLELSAISDFNGTVPGLADVLYENDGELLFFTFVPDNEDVQDADGQFWATAAPFGGEGAGLWQYTLSMPMPEAATLTPKP